ncbi:MAG: zinc ABC transporter substrate-binding protein ZnuA [Pseudomonadota bacterium]
MHTAAAWAAGLLTLAASVTAARADVQVVASIKPVHSLVAGVMKGVAEPTLIVDGAASPHTYSLKPSQAAAIEKADVVFWVGHELEAFLEKPLETLGSKAQSVELIDASSLVKFEVREGEAFEAHAHDDDHHDEKKAEAKHGHGHGKHDDHHAEKKKTGHDDDHGHGHGHDAADAHIWLDPKNAIALVAEIKSTLIKADAANAAKYEANAKELTDRLNSLITEIDSAVKPIRGKRFVVFHDAYQYFEKRFGLQATGSVTVSPEVMPGARRINELRGKVKKLGVACVFSEPQFEPKLVSTVTEGTPAKSGVLDPLGASLQGGPDLYFALVRNMASSFRSCLSQAS